MKTQLRLIIVALLIIITSCEQSSPLEKEFIIHSTITDLDGIQIKDSHAGSSIKISSPQLKEILSKYPTENNVKLLFEDKPGKILEAKDDYIVAEIPIMHLQEPQSVSIYLKLSGIKFLLCAPCFTYRPSVRGIVFTGIRDGKSDGTFTTPAEMTTDQNGNLYVIDQQNNGHDIVKLVTPLGEVSTFVGRNDRFGRLVGIGIDQIRGLMYLADATAQRIRTVDLSATASNDYLAGSGTLGNVDGVGRSASFHFGDRPVTTEHELGQGLVVDSNGNVYVGEMYGEVNRFDSQIRKVTPDGVVSTVLGSRITAIENPDDWASPTGVAFGEHEEELAYVSGMSSYFQGVTTISLTGNRTSLSGRVSFEDLIDGTGSASEFACPKAITFKNNDYYVADGTNGALRSVSSTGVVTTIAGVGHFSTNTYCGCGEYLPPIEGSYVRPLLSITPEEQLELANNIRMDQVGGVASPQAGVVYVSDYGYKCIWKITIN